MYENEKECNDCESAEEQMAYVLARFNFVLIMCNLVQLLKFLLYEDAISLEFLLLHTLLSDFA